MKSAQCRASTITWLLLLLAGAGVVFLWLRTARMTPDETGGRSPGDSLTNYQVTQVRPGVLEMRRGSNNAAPRAVLTTNAPAPPTSGANLVRQAAGATNGLVIPAIRPVPSADATNRPPPPGVWPATDALARQSHGTTLDPNSFPRPTRDVLEAQIALERLGISPGSIDGVFGSQTQSALRAFQREWGLAERGELDATARVELILDRPPLTNFVVLSNDLARLQPVGRTWLEKSRQSAMDYETLLELVAEKSRANPNLIRRLNPRVNWTNAPAGTVLVVPDARPAEDRTRVSWITIKLQEKVLQAFDAEQNLVAHFPCSIARRVEKRPVGDLFVAVAAENPDYTFDPAVFPESAEARQLKTRLLIPPGPNNPVGTAWIGLSKPGYGIHGTPAPEQVGRTESHGCFRLANWNADRLIKMVSVGTPVYVKP